MGWNAGGEKELFSINELVESFSLEGITTSSGRFDPERCKWFNQQHLQNIDPSILVLRLEQELEKRRIPKKEVDLNRVITLIQERLVLLTDIWTETCFFFEVPEVFDEKAIQKQWKEGTTEILTTVCKLLACASETTAHELNSLVKGWAKKNNVGLGKVMAPLRLALVGALRGPDVFEICSVIGISECLNRINNAIKEVSS